MDLCSRIETAAPDEVLIAVSPAIARRVVGVGALVLLGVLVIWFGFDGDGALYARVGLIALGVAMLVFARFIWLSSGTSLELTSQELREKGGRLIARVDQITRVERGMAILKPSNGLLVHTREGATRVYAPGLWWRSGRLVAIGGMTNAGQAKAMAEVLQILLKRRDAAEG